jgi:hypothetical protein
VDALEGFADSGHLAEDLTDLLVAVGEAASEKRVGLLLAIDELQYLAATELGALITAIHRTTQLNLPVILVGAGLPQLPGLAGDAKSYAERLFEFPEVGSLTFDQASAALSIPAEELGVSYDDGALDVIFEASHGYPYFLQEWGYHVWNYAPSPRISRGVCRATRHRPPRPELLSGALRPPYPEGEGLPACHGRARTRSSSLGRYRGLPRREGRVGCSAALGSHRERNDLQSGAWRHCVHGAALRRVSPARDAPVESVGVN